MRTSSRVLALMVAVVAVAYAVIHLVYSPSVSAGAGPQASTKGKAAPSRKKTKPESTPIKAPPFKLGNGHTSVMPQLTAKGDDLELQKEIASQLSKFDPRPPARLAHFRHLVQGDTVCVGWAADILSVTPDDLGLLVKIRVRPQLVKTQLMLPSDSVDEIYHLSPGNVRYIGGEVSPDVVPGGMSTF